MAKFDNSTENPKYLWPTVQNPNLIDTKMIKTIKLYSDYTETILQVLDYESQVQQVI